jgi:tetratricopeptide (TPR) repeat protein
MSNTRRARLPEWTLWIIGAATILAAAVLILAVVLGVRAGQQQIEIQARQQVGIHLQRAIDLRAEGNLEAALAEYQQVMLLDPGNVAAVEGIESLLAIARGADPAPAMPQNTASTQATSAVEAAPAAAQSPLATPAPTLTALDQQWVDARAAYNNGRWADAVDLLTALRAANPSYETDAVTEMLFTAYVNLGAEKDQAGKLEEALELVDAALELRPDETELRSARSLAAKYLDVLTYFGADWERAVGLLNELYLINPSYRDVEERLQEALVALGDDLLDEGDWCDAAEQYILAIEIDVTPGLIDKRDEARDACRSETGVAGVSPTRRSATRTPTPQAAAADRTRTPSATSAASAAVASVTPSPTPMRTVRATLPATATPATSSENATATPTPEPTVAPPAAAPTDGQLLFASVSPDDNRSRIYAVPVGGDQPQVVVEDGIQPALRNDGVRLAYYNTREDMAGISSFDPGSGLELRFTRFAEDRWPSWSPDGNRLVFGSNREGDRRWRIYVAWAEVDGEAASQTFGESPAWHPTADTIVYRGCDDTGNRCGLWTMTSAGSGKTPLTSVPEDTLPAWSPDGRSVVFTSNGRHGNYDVYRVDVSTGDVFRLTRDPANDGVPTVSPDGRWVAFLSDRGGAWQIWGIPLEGGEAIRLANLPGGVGSWLDQTIQWVE